MNSKKQTTKDVKYRKCSECKQSMVFIPRRPKCMDCYKKGLTPTMHSAIDLFIPEDD